MMALKTSDDFLHQEIDTIIIGGGPAGLSAAVNLARLRRSVLVIDDRDGRSLWGQINRNYLGFPNGIPAAKIRLAGRAQAARYGAHFLAGQVNFATPDGKDFMVRVSPSHERPAHAAGRHGNVAADREDGRSHGEIELAASLELRGRTLIIAAGVRDQFPRFPGWEQCVGQSLFWCILCDGYEAIDKTVAVVGDDEEAAETALDLLDFTSKITLVAGSAAGFSFSQARAADLTNSGIAIYPYAINEYVCGNGQINALVLKNPASSRLPADMVFAYRHPIARNEVAAMLGVELNAIGQIVVDAEQHTNLHGVYAAGDVTSPHDHQVSAAVHEGNQAAAAANYYLYRPIQRSGGRPAR